MNEKRRLGTNRRIEEEEQQVEGERERERERERKRKERKERKERESSLIPRLLKWQRKIVWIQLFVYELINFLISKMFNGINEL